MTEKVPAPEFERGLLEQTDNGWHIGDPVEQPPQTPEVMMSDDDR